MADELATLPGQDGFNDGETDKRSRVERRPYTPVFGGLPLVPQAMPRRRPYHGAAATGLEGRNRNDLNIHISSARVTSVSD